MGQVKLIITITTPITILFLWSDYYAKGWHDVRRGLSQLLAFIIQHESMYHNYSRERSERLGRNQRKRKERDFMKIIKKNTEPLSQHIAERDIRLEKGDL